MKLLTLPAVPAARLAAALLVTALLGACAVGPGSASYPLALLGAPAPPEAGIRTIVITPQTRWINVEGGETIRLVSGTHAFGWTFDGPADSFDLMRVAPPGALDHTVTAFVAPNPLYLREGRH